MPVWRTYWLALGVGLLAVLAGYLRYAPPPIMDPSSEGPISLERTLRMLDVLVGDQIPHPADSPQNEVVRQRIMDLLAEIGLETEQHVTQGIHFLDQEEVPLVNLIYEIYRMLPNDTDFTVYREAGMEGWNFAFIGNVKHYHTPDDRIENVDPRSIQHHAEQAFALMKKLANQRQVEIRPGRAVYFDYLGWRVFRWDEQLVIPLAILPTVAWLLAGLWVLRSGRWKMSALVGAGLLVLGWLVVCGLVLLALFESLKWQGYFSPPWPDWPLPLWILFWSMVAVTAWAVGQMAVRWGLQSALYTVVWSLWLGVLWLVSLYAPGASHLFLIPALWAVLVGWLPGLGAATRGFLAWLGVAGLWLPLEPLYYDALGFMFRDVLVLRLLLVGLAFLPAGVEMNRR